MLVTALALPACGSKDSPQLVVTTTTPTTAAPKADEPKGKLSADEYRSLREAYEVLAPLDSVKLSRKALRSANRACSKMATHTELVSTVRADCMQTMRFYGKALAMATRESECTRAAQAGDMSCFADVFRSFGRSVRVAAVRAAATNNVLRKRAIGGDCARAIGTDVKELAAARDANRAGIAAAHAIEAKNKEALQRARDRLGAALDRMDSADQSSRAALRQLKSCV